MIHEIRIQNFKSIRDLTLRLSPVTVLVGRSGTGKSNFVLAVRFLRDILNGEQNGLQRLQVDWAATKPLPATEDPTCFDVSFSVNGVDGEYHYSLHIPATGPAGGLLRESLTLGENTLFCQEGAPTHVGGSGTFGGGLGGKATWTTEPALVEVPPPGTIALGRIPSLAEVVIAYTALTEGIGCYTFHNDVAKQLPVNRPFGQQPGVANGCGSGLDDVASNYLTTMKEIVSNLQDLSIRKNIVAALRRVNTDVVSVELNDIRKPTHAVVGHKFGDRILGLNLGQESEGFRRSLAHLLALYQRPPKQVLMFEHPEDGIHPGALALLAEEFLCTPDDGRGQVILTTHSPGLLDHFTEDQIRVVEREDFCTKIGPVSSEQKAALREELMDAGELLTVDPARLDVMETASE